MNTNRIIPILLVITILGAGIYFLSVESTSPTPEPGTQGPETPCDRVKTPDYCNLLDQIQSLGKESPIELTSFARLVNNIKTNTNIDAKQSDELQQYALSTCMDIINNETSKKCQTVSNINQMQNLKDMLKGLDQIVALDDKMTGVRSRILATIDELEDAFQIDEQVVSYLTNDKYDLEKTTKFRNRIQVVFSNEDFKNNTTLQSKLKQAKNNLTAFDKWYAKRAPQLDYYQKNSDDQVFFKIDGTPITNKGY